MNYIKTVLCKEAYLWSETPEHILVKYKILRPDCGYNVKSKSKDKTITDTGIDIIQIDSETECTLIQCKNGIKKV